MAASRHPRVRLQHIKDEIASLRAATDGVTEEEFVSSYVLKRTTEHAVLIISETVRALPIDLTDHYPGPRWADIRGIGNILRHDYFAVEARVLWDIVRNHLPGLADVTEAMIQDLADP